MSPPSMRDTPGAGFPPGEGRVTMISPFRSAQGPARTSGPRGLSQPRQAFSGPLFSTPSDPFRAWESLTPVRPDAGAMARLGLASSDGLGPSAGAFDVLRTRLLQGMEERGWTRLAVTSPTHGCGKSFTAINLGFSMSRLPGKRVVLVDLELRDPGLAKALGIADAAPIREFLSNDQPMESHFRRIGSNFGLCLNGEPVADASALLNDAGTAEALDAMQEALCPDLVLYDLPPALVSDDVIAFRPQIDAVLLVADGTKTTADDIRRCERLFDTRIPLMGVVLNRAQDRGLGRYVYGGR